MWQDIGPADEYRKRPRVYVMERGGHKAHRLVLEELGVDGATDAHASAAGEPAAG